MNRGLIFGAVVVGAALAVGCRAGPQPEDVGTATSALALQGLFDTGVDGSGNPLAIGAIDPHYVLSGNDPINIGPHALAVTPPAGAGWTPNTASAEWISTQASALGTANTTDNYTLTFSIPVGQDPTSATLSATYFCSEICSVFLNGTQVGNDAVAMAWVNPAALTVAAGGPFVLGSNALDFRVQVGIFAAPTGVQVTGMGGTVGGSGCTQDGQCSAGNWCDESTGACTPTLANGTAVPSDPPHTNPTLNGVCTAGAGALVCTSGVCDVHDNDCGYAVGDGPCTAGNAGVVCRSGSCSVNLTCEPAGGCNVDADCSGGKWCDESTHTCTPQVANGGAVPTDPPHTNPTLNGMCTAAAGVLTCVSSVCDTDNKCGYANGDGPCTVVTGTVVCRSGACSVNGTCEPVGGCNIDADCPAGKWCDETTNICTPTVANGGAVPTDPVHTNPTLNGQCTAAAATLVCQSGVCDPADNDCGLANGDGPCTVADGGVVCRSGMCNAGGTCGPLVGCTLDADCSAGNWCDESTHTCAPTVANGGAVPTDPPHTNPTLNGMCTAAAGALTCTSAVCDVNDNRCGYANGDGPCTAGDAGVVCRSGTCSVNLTCEPMNGCNVDADCSGGNWCDESIHTCTAKIANGGGLPIDGPHTNPTLNGTCTAAAATLVCQSGVCDPADNKCGYANSDGPCTAGNAGVVCRSDACSVNLTCEPMGGCNVDADCSSADWCNETLHTCTLKLTNGTLVANDPAHMSPTLNGTCTLAAGVVVCQSAVCDTDNKCGYANGDGPCTVANGGVVCRSGTCSANGTCETAGTCNVDSDCSGGKWCDESTNICTPKIANGGGLPTDGPHTNPTLNGMCTVAAATLVCVSGVCDTADNDCGYATGDGPCTVANGGVVCRSGACSVNLTCEPMGGCNVDADCSGGKWCLESAHTCTAQLANGTPLPTDAPHTSPTLNGMCSAAAATLVCASGVCDTDNECGYANGDGSCTMATGGIVCRSGMCSSNGTCGPAIECEVDTDCASADWCNETLLTCTPKLANGVAVATDPAHTSPTLNGTCTAAAGAAVCVSAVCDTHDNDCGYADGDGPCTSANGDTVCRSTLCATAGPNMGVCVACLMDSQCSGTTPTCSATTNTCVQCTASNASACIGSTPVCAVTTSTCVPCDGDHGSTATAPCPDSATPHCFTTGTAAGTCGKCMTDADCTGDPSGPICNTTTGVCGPGCSKDSDCGGSNSGQVCNTTTATCEPGCRGMGGNGCPTMPALTCTSTDNTIGMCVQCTSDANCGGPMSGEVCSANMMCGPGCRGKDGNGCPSGEVCSSTTSTIGTCSTPGTGGTGGGTTTTTGSGGQNDGFTASGNGLLCAARPGRDDGASGWLVGGMLGVLAALRRRRRLSIHLP